MLASRYQRAEVFPAYAGMSPLIEVTSSSRARFPRLRGDEPHPVHCSPPSSFVFPAYAGMSPSTGKRPRRHCSFPRLRGDEPELP